MKKEYEDKSYDIAKLNQSKHKANAKQGQERPIPAQNKVGSRKFKRNFLRRVGML